MLRKQNFEQYLNDATDNYRLETDWDVIMKLCDLIRQGDVKPNHALNAIQKKISNPNSVIALYGLTVLESCVKNCGALIQDEISTKQFMESFKDIIKSCPNENVKTKCLDLLQSWAFAFRNNPKHRAVQDTVTIMKTEGYKFPTFKESDAMFSADTAPSWKDGDRCHRCRTIFTLINRKHHCRACGEVFCQQCSSHSITLPKFGIEKQVRVCDTCLEKCHKSVGIPKTEDLPNEYSTATLPLANQQQYSSNKKTEDELKEEEELQLAIALSQSEAESKKPTCKPVTRSKSFSPPTAYKTNHTENDDVELTRYLNRSYWEDRIASGEKIRDSEDSSIEKKTPVNAIYDFNSTQEKLERYVADDSDSEIDSFVDALRNQVEILVNRMKSNSSRGRSIANDTSVQTLFLNITTMHSRLLKYIQQQDDSRVYYEGLQDKLTQVKDARAALDALREEHRERLRREAEIAERQRQIQMAQKLEIMRQKKQEYLQYQRQLALKRIHDQERELHMRQEQQMQQYRLSNAYSALPYVGPQSGGVSAFEPVSSMTINMNPSTSSTVGPFLPTQPQPQSSSSFSTHFSQGQNISSVVPPQQQITSANVYLPLNHCSSAPLPPSQLSLSQSQQPPPSSSTNSSTVPAHGQLVGMQQPSSQFTTPQHVLHSGVSVNPHQPQAAFVDAQNISSVAGLHIDQNIHAIGSPCSTNIRSEHNSQIIGSSSSHGVAHPVPNASLMQPSNVGRSVIPPSSSPLSSPSSSSEHSLIQHGPQPVPSAPSATSTPQPEDKEDIAELICFD